MNRRMSGLLSIVVMALFVHNAFGAEVNLQTLHCNIEGDAKDYHFLIDYQQNRVALADDAGVNLQVTSPPGADSLAFAIVGRRETFTLRRRDLTIVEVVPDWYCPTTITNQGRCAVETIPR